MAVEVSIEDPNGCRGLNLGSQSLSRSHKKKGIQSHLTSGLILPLSFAYLFFTFDVFFPLYRNQQPSSSYSVGAFVEQCLTNCSRHHQPSPKQKFGVLLEDPQRLSSSQLRIPNHSTEIWGLIKRNGSKASHLASWLIPQISRSFHFWVYLFMTFLVFYFHPLSKLLSFSQLTPFSYFHPLSSEICEQLSRNCSGLPRNQIQATGPSPNRGLNGRHQSMSRSQPRIPNHVTKILRSHIKRDPKLFGILTYSASLSNFFF